MRPRIAPPMVARNLIESVGVSGPSSGAKDAGLTANGANRVNRALEARVELRPALPAALLAGTVLGLGIVATAPTRMGEAAQVAGGSGHGPAGIRQTIDEPVSWDLPVVRNE